MSWERGQEQESRAQPGALREVVSSSPRPCSSGQSSLSEVLHLIWHYQQEWLFYLHFEMAIDELSAVKPLQTRPSSLSGFSASSYFRTLKKIYIYI